MRGPDIERFNTGGLREVDGLEDVIAFLESNQLSTDMQYWTAEAKTPWYFAINRCIQQVLKERSEANVQKLRTKIDELRDIFRQQPSSWHC